MSRTDELLDSEPFGLGDKDGLFMEALKESLSHHYASCDEFRRLCDRRGFDPSGKFSLEDVPYLPVGIFKTLKLLSVKEECISGNVESSSTSGVPSRIYLDDITTRRQRKALNSIMSSFIGLGRKTFVIFDSESTVKPKDGVLSSRATAIRGFLPFMKKAFYILDDDLRLDEKALKAASDFVESGEEVCFLGFTFLIYQVLESGGEFPDFGRSRVLHLGGWKKLQSLDISKDEFNNMVSRSLHTGPERVMDIYGMTEQLGTIYPDCEHGYKHVPSYSDIIIRDPVTLKPVEDGKPGFIQLISPLPHSYPGVSVISDDIGVLVKRDGCECGRRGKTFLFKSRSEKAEIKGCGDTLRDDT